MKKEGVIREKKEATTWCSRGCFVRKEDTARLITDMRQLNKCLDRPTKPYTSPEQIQKNLHLDSTCVAILDMVSSYYQMRLTEESMELTTFFIPQGRYQYTCVPLCLSPSSDWLNMETEILIKGDARVHKNMDDCLIEGSNPETLYQRLREVCLKTRSKNIKLSKKKFKLGREVLYSGFMVKYSEESKSLVVVPDPCKLAALNEIEAPKTKQDLLSLLGAIKTFEKWSPDISFS